MSFIDRAIPLAPGGDAEGKPLVELDHHECHFPIRGTGATTFYCAAPVAADDWKRGRSLGSYCAFHANLASSSRAAARAQPSIKWRHWL